MSHKVHGCVLKHNEQVYNILKENLKGKKINPHSIRHFIFLPICLCVFTIVLKLKWIYVFVSEFLILTYQMFTWCDIINTRHAISCLCIKHGIFQLFYSFSDITIPERKKERFFKNILNYWHLTDYSNLSSRFDRKAGACVHPGLQAGNRGGKWKGSE